MLCNRSNDGGYGASAYYCANLNNNNANNNNNNNVNNNNNSCNNNGNCVYNNNNCSRGWADPNTNYYSWYGTRSYNSRKASSSSGVDTSVDDDGMVGVILGSVLCFFLFCIIIFSIAYPLTMYRENPGRYSDDKWWCYNCNNAAFCGSRCW